MTFLGFTDLEGSQVFINVEHITQMRIIHNPGSEKDGKVCICTTDGHSVIIRESLDEIIDKLQSLCE